MIALKEFEVWFVTGSQHLYGEATLKKVEQHSREMVEWLNRAGKLPVKLVASQTPISIDRSHAVLFVILRSRARCGCRCR